MRSSLESRTVRPGLAAYSFYRSDRRPVSRTETKKSKPQTTVSPRAWRMVVVGVLILGAITGFKTVNNGQPSLSSATATLAGSHSSGSKQDACMGTQEQHIRVSISQRHLWACANGTTAYEVPVITGMEKHDETRSPVGTYTIYAKQAKVTLTGSDSTGSWRDPVDYWMPFLDNQYGTYGFHDATWRQDGAFGKVDPNSEQASHGCVELPLRASKWLYEWAHVGTKVSIES